MAELSLEQKCTIAAELVVQSPPGEVNDVINDLRGIINDDDALMVHVRPALRDYTLSQLASVEHAATDGVPAHTTLLSKATILPGTEGADERHVDAEGKRSFVFDHITSAVSDYQPYELPKEEEAFRAELAKSFAAYTKNHFQTASASVSCSQYPLLPPAPTQTSDDNTSPVETTEDEQLGGEGGDTVERPSVEESSEADALETAGEESLEGKPAPAGDATEAAPPAQPKVEEESHGAVQEGVPEGLAEGVEGIKGVEGVEGVEGVGEGVAVADIVEGVESVEGVEGVEETRQAASAAPEAAPRQVEEKQEQQRVESPVYTLEVVGNRYNPSNFWTGRWRSSWVVDQAGGIVNGTIQVDVHYYEQGNVQLANKHNVSFPCPIQDNGSQSIASQIVTAIANAETHYQLELTDVYSDLGEKAFRALRRGLPVTKQKMDWDKVGGYSLGSDLNKARA